MYGQALAARPGRRLHRGALAAQYGHGRLDTADIAARGRRHYDAVKAALDAAEARVGKPALAELHAALGDAWDDFRAAFAMESFGDRSGGTDKPTEDPPVGVRR